MSADGVAWDYSALAADYDRRPDYDAALLAQVLAQLELPRPACVLDVGAGTGKLTMSLCDAGHRVVACEPNARMRSFGRANRRCAAASWIAARGEALPLRAESVDLVAYGSSFNVLDAMAATREAARVLRPGGAWLALWNHRDLDDPLQREIESIVHRHVPHYDYGSRRRDPGETFAACDTFEPLRAAQASFRVHVDAQHWLRAWNTHATLRRQAGAAFPAILDAIAACLHGIEQVEVPYHTRLWWTRRRAQRA